MPTIIAIVITAVWTLSFLLDIVLPKYDPNPTVHALMMAVAGAVFGGSLINRDVSKAQAEVEEEGEKK